MIKQTSQLILNALKFVNSIDVRAVLTKDDKGISQFQNA